MLPESSLSGLAIVVGSVYFVRASGLVWMTTGLNICIGTTGVCVETPYASHMK